MLILKKEKMTLTELHNKLEELTHLETTCKDPFGVVRKSRQLNIQRLNAEIKSRKEIDDAN